MEIIYIILLLVIIIILINNKNALNTKIDHIEYRLQELQQLIKRSAENKTGITTDTKPVEPIPYPKAAEPVISLQPEVEQPVTPPVVEHQAEIINDTAQAINKPITPPYYHVDEPQLSFFERYPDLEKFIGENLVNKIGIAILVLAIGFFVKYAIDNNWIGPIGRVGIGVLCGGVLIGIAHRLRNSYRSFSSVLVGGGLAVLYFTITLAYHQFHLFNQTASFIIMIVITCFAVALSFLYDKQELAVIALIGGLASPFMVSSGNANYNALFIYLIILNAGLLVIAYYKSWRILNVAAFALTVLIISGVIYTLTAPNYTTAFSYISLLYLIFFAINVANNVRENKKFVASDFSILLANTALFFGAGLYLLTEMQHEELRGLFSAALALINLILSYVLFRNKKVDINILYLLIGITLTFLSLTAPIQLNGHNITLFWAAEGVLLYWLYRKSTIPLLKLTALIVWVAMAISLFLDWLNIYSTTTNTLTIIANKGFITTLAAAISSYLIYFQAVEDNDNTIYGYTFPVDSFKVVAFILLFMSGLLEINHQFSNRYPETSLNNIYLMLYVPVYVYSLHLVSKKILSIEPGWKIKASVISACVIVYLLFMSRFYDTVDEILIFHKTSGFHFAAHWIGAIFIGLLFYELILITKNHFTAPLQNIISWILVLVIVIFLSVEMSLLAEFLFYPATNSIDKVDDLYIKVGLPILWGLISFSLMWLGMRYNQRSLRIISLTLFLIILIKLFVIDISNIPSAGKIAAFFCLGVLLLIISFMYQKVKKIIVEDEDINKVQ